MLPLYPDLPTTATAFWVGIVVAVVHYVLRRRVVELFGTGFGLIVVGSAVQWWGQGIIADTTRYEMPTKPTNTPNVAMMP